MNAKEYLQQLQKADLIINQKIQEKTDLLAKLSSIRGINYSKERVQVSFQREAPYTASISKIVDLENEIECLICDYANLKHKIISEIQELSNRKYMDILYKRYIEDKSLEQISIEMNYSYDYIRHTHRHALQEFDNQIFKNNTK